MNRLSGHISRLKVSGVLSLVTVSLSEGDNVSAIIIETPESASYLKKGHPVSVVFKETEVVLAKGEPHLSLLNRIHGKIGHIKKGELLSEVGVLTKSGQINAIISSEALEIMDLKSNDTVVAMIKQNEVMLAE